MRWTHKAKYGPLDVRRFGARGNERDDTRAIQAALDEAAVAGGAVYLPFAVRTTAPLVIHGRGVRLSADSALYHHSEPRRGSPAVILSDHDGPCIDLCSTSLWVDITLERIALRSNLPRLANGDKQGAGIRLIDTDKSFCSRLHLDHCDISQFGTGFLVDRDPEVGERQVAAQVRITNCNIEHNTRGVWFENNARINGLCIRDNYIRHNKQGISVSVTLAEISNNILEGQANPLQFGGEINRNVECHGNYFEASTGDYAIRLHHVHRFVLGQQRM